MYTWNSTTVVLKTELNLDSKQKTLYYALNPSKSSQTSLSYFMNQVRSRLNSLLGNSLYEQLGRQKNNSHLFSQLWTGHDVIIDDKSSTERSVLISLRSLIEQREYLYLMLLRHHAYLPKVLATCGPIYATEYAPVTPSLNPPWSTVLMTSQLPSFSTRASIALQLLDIIQSLDNDYKESMLFCDMKGINFGMTSQGHLKAIDTDTVFLQTFRAKRSSKFSCNNDRDCDFQYCMGQCNIITKKCEIKIVNNNLQAACNVILLPHWRNKFTGLLSRPPASMAAELDQTLHECVRLVYDRVGNTENVLLKLKSLLKHADLYM